jgi:ribosome maturation factor RimP
VPSDFPPSAWGGCLFCSLLGLGLFGLGLFLTKEFSGILTGREGSTITVETENGTVNFEASAASTVRLCDDEDLFD